jgi:hypothetical protein
VFSLGIGDLWCVSRTRSIKRMRTMPSSLGELGGGTSSAISTAGSSGVGVPGPPGRNSDWRVNAVQRELGGGLVATCAQNDADALAVVGEAQLLIDSAEVEVHLGDRLGPELADLQVDDHETPQQVVVEEQVREDLAGRKTETVAQPRSTPLVDLH